MLYVLSQFNARCTPPHLLSAELLNRLLAFERESRCKKASKFLARDVFFIAIKSVAREFIIYYVIPDRKRLLNQISKR